MRRKIIAITAVVLLMTAFFISCSKKEEQVSAVSIDENVSETDTEKPQATPESDSQDDVKAAVEITAVPEMVSEATVGLIYSSAGYESDYYARQVQNLMALSSAQITVIEYDTADGSAAQAAAELIQAGCTIIFASGVEDDEVIAAAKENSGVYFEICGGTSTGSLENVSLLNARFYQQQYLNGMAAAYASETGNIGYVSPNAESADIRMVNAFALGAKAANSEAVVHFAWTGEISDNDSETIAALVQKGCDVVFDANIDETSLEYAKENGVSLISSYNDDAVMPMIEPGIASYLLLRISAQAAGTYASNGIISGWFSSESYISESGYDFMTAEELEDIKAKAAEMQEGSWDVFSGPITDSYGQTIVPEGMVLPDEDLLYMLWYVENIEASSPPMG